MATEKPSSWAEHLAAAKAMGVSEREAFETYDGWPAQVKASRERRKAFTAYLDARDELEQGGES